MADQNEFEVVIPVRVRDDTGEGVNEAVSSAERMRERVASGSKKAIDDSTRGSAKILSDFERHAEMSSRGVENAFKKSAETSRKESQTALGALEKVFNSHNFLLRSMAREAGARHLALALGVAKIGLAYKGMSGDVEEATLKSGRALEQLIRSQVLSYSQLGDLAGRVNAKNGERMVEFLTIQVGKLQRSLTSVTSMLEKARDRINQVQTAGGNKLADFKQRLNQQFGGRVDIDFLKDFSKIEDKAGEISQRFKFITGRLGNVPGLDTKFISDLDKAAINFQILERNAKSALELAETKASKLQTKVHDVRSELDLARNAMDKWHASGTAFNPALQKIEELGKKLSGLRTNLSSNASSLRIPTNFENAISSKLGLSGEQRNVSRLDGQSFIRWTDSLKPAQKEIAATEGALAKLEGAAGGAAGGMEGVGGAAGGMGISLTAVGIAIAGVIILVVAAIAAFIAFTAITYSSAKAAAEWGDEIYRMEKATGLSAGTLTTLSVIAKEMKVDTKSLGETFGRLEAQISRGLTKPTTEAGRALKTLKLDFNQLRSASPDEQFKMVSSALAGLNNENTKAHVATQLLGRDFAKNSNILTEVASKFEETQAKVRRLGLELDENGAVKSHQFMVALDDITLAGQALYMSLGKEVLPQVAGLLDDVTNLLVDQNGRWGSLQTMAVGVTQAIRLEVIKLTDALAVFNATLSQGLIFAGVASYLTYYYGDKNAKTKMSKEDSDRLLNMQIDATKLSMAGANGSDRFEPGSGKKKHEETELERLQKQLKKLVGEIKALQEVTTPEYELKFKVETFSRVKSGMEEILKLRYELGLQFDAPLPEFNVLGTKEEQTTQLEAIKEHVLQLNRLKSIFDGVRKTAGEQSDALAKLAQVQQEAYMPVVSASIRAETKYFEAIRARRNAEQELTADVVVQSRLRADAIKDEIGETLKAYQTLRLEFGKSEDDQRQQRLKDQIFVQVMSGGEDTVIKKLEGRLQENLEPNKVPTQMQMIAEHAANIDSNVHLIALKITGEGKPPADYSTGQRGQLGTGNSDGIIFEAGPGKTYTGSAGDNNPPTTTDNSWSQVTMNVTGVNTPTAGQSDSSGIIDNLETEKVYTNYIVRLREQIIRESEGRIAGERDASVRKSIQNEIDAENRLGHQLIDIDQAVKEQRAVNAANREIDERVRTLSIIKLEDQLKDISTGNAFELKRQWDEAYNSRLQHAIQLKDTIVQLEDANAHAGEDAADRIKIAYLTEINSVLDADTQAKESMVRSSVKLADQTVFHAGQAQAKWLEFLASQKGVTEIIADANIGVFNTTFDLIGSGLDRVLGKLGIAKDLVKELVLNWLKLAAAQLFGGQQQQQRGGGIGSIITGTLGNVLRPGTTGGNTSISAGLNFGSPFLPGQTGGFVGGNPIQQILDSGLGGVHNQFAGNYFGTNGLEAPAGQTGGIGNTAIGVAGNLGSSAVSTATRSGFSLASLGASFAPLAPLLGLGLGTSVGGGSGLSGILGGAGGLLLGGSAAAALGLFGGGAVAGSLGSAAAAGLGGAAVGGGLAAGLSAFLLNPFTIGAAAALLVGAYFLNRNKQRRKDEELRASILTDSKGKLLQILSNVNADRMDGAEAIAQAGAIRSEYLTQVGQIKDRKTRRIAEETVRELDAIISQINEAVKRQDKRKEFENKFTPTFADGSVSGGSLTVNDYMYRKYHQFDPRSSSASGVSDTMSSFVGRVPGNYDRQDDRMARLTGDEVVLTPTMWRPIEPYLRQINVPGFGTPTRQVYNYRRSTTVQGAYQNGGTLFANAPMSQSSNVDMGAINITVGHISIDASGIVFHGMKSDTNQRVVLNVVDKDIRINREDGVVIGGITSVQNGG